MKRIIDRIVADELNEGDIREIKAEQKELDTISRIANESKGKSNYSLLEVGKFVTAYDDTPTPYFVTCICGGLNGPGNWMDYFDDLKKLVANFEKSYNAWIIQIENDCCDDVHYVFLGLEEKDKQKE